MIITNPNKQILFVSDKYQGSMHDFNIFKKLFSDLDFSALRVYVDLGFLGIKKVIQAKEILLPHKASKLHPLTETQKQANKEMNRIRVGIENAIAKVKVFFILRTKNRMRIKEKLNQAFQLCSLIANYKTN